MTLSALGVTAVYAGSGSVGPFSLTDAGANPILFKVNSEIVVQKFINPDDSHPTLLAITTDYTLTGAGLGTPGAVTLIAPLAAGQTLVISRASPVTQTLDLTFGGDLSLENLEDTLDKLVRLIQERKDVGDRSLLFSATHPTLAGAQSRVFPAPTASTFIAWNAAADRLEAITRSPYFLSGAGAPSALLGIDGDFYLDTVTKILYGPKTGGTWGISVSLVGPPGVPGIQGPPGPLGSGSGDMTGPASSTDNAVTRFDLATGKVIQNSVVLIGDTGVVTGVLSIDLPNAGLLLRDTNASHTLQISPGSDLTANRIFTLTTGDAARTLNISAASVTISAFAATLLDDADAATMRATIGAGTGDVTGPAAGVVDNEFAFYNSTTGKIIKGSSQLKATVADVRAAVANRVMTTDLIQTASAFVTLSNDFVTIPFDWTAGINFISIITANRVLGNPTNAIPGTWRTIVLSSNAAGPFILTFGNQYWGEIPVLEDISSTRLWLLTVFCYTASHFIVSAKRGF